MSIEDAARDARLTLYFTPGSCSLAPLAALEEAGAAYKLVRVDLAAGEQRSARYLAINPRGRVPTLAINGRPMGENVAILTYLAHRYPEAGLLPLHEPETLGRAYELLAWLTSTVQVSVSQVFRPARFTDEEEVQVGLRRDGPALVAGHFEAIEAGLTGDWALGLDFSVLDPLLLVFWRWGERLALPMDRYVRWAAHTARVRERACVRRALEREAAA